MSYICKCEHGKSLALCKICYPICESNSPDFSFIYETFEDWRNGNWLEDGEPRKKAYTKDELLLVEMGWKYGFDAGLKKARENE